MKGPFDPRSFGAPLRTVLDFLRKGDVLMVTRIDRLDQRFLGSNHIRLRPQVCRTKYG
jgi:DNA invertase Pin-like site-specific DNA recombinase